MLTCFFGGLIIFYLIHVSIRGLNIWAQYLGSWAASALVLPNLEWEKKSFSIGGVPAEFFLGLWEIAKPKGVCQASPKRWRELEELHRSIAQRLEMRQEMSGIFHQVWKCLEYLSFFFDTSSHSVLRTQDLRMTCRSMSSWGSGQLIRRTCTHEQHSKMTWRYKKRKHV